MADYSEKLRESKVCRIFFSSPFNGMEGEREELTRRYFPQIHHLCNSKGLQFVAVDMRWGITKESSDNAQVIRICLQELDRSDLFIGFFGQRYGWHGSEDEALQKNFNNAIPFYPWLENFHDRSVTELEFLHGHLNLPGKLPAGIFFRDKAWDDIYRKIGEEKENKGQIYKFSSESETATSCMNDLKARIKATEDKLIGCHMSYSTPVEGAKLMFEAIWKHLTEVLLVTPDKQLSKREIEKSLHSAFMLKLCNIYIGGEEYVEKLNNYIKSDSNTPLVLLGDPGTGKSALLSNWLQGQLSVDKIVVYHFIAASRDSADYRNLLSRLTVELHYELSKREEVDSDRSELTFDVNKTINDLLQQFIDKLNEVAQKGYETILVIDGLNKRNDPGKIGQHLFWIPRTLPESVHLIVSTTQRDVEGIKELEERKYSFMSFEPLNLQQRTDLCIRLLKEPGKEFSPHQLEKVVSSKKSSVPLFLKIVVEELCVFGYFFKLDQKIEYLMESKNTVELFEKFLERLEKDYNDDSVNENLVKQIMTTVYVSEDGIQEKDLINIFNIPSHVWSPLYFAMEKVLINRATLLNFAFGELSEAVDNRYLQDSNQISQQRKQLASHYATIIQECLDEDLPFSDYIVENLPKLYSKLEDKESLCDLLLNLKILDLLFKKNAYDVLAYWSLIDVIQEEMTKRYLNSLDMLEVELYAKSEDNYEDPNVPVLIHPYIHLVGELMQFGGYFTGYEQMLLREKQLLESSRSVCPRLYEGNYWIVINALGTLYADTDRLDESENMLSMVLEERQKTCDGSKESLYNVAATIHGLAATNLYKKDYDKSSELFEQYLDIIKSVDEADENVKREKIYSFYTNMGTIRMEQNRWNEAVELMEKGVKLVEEKHLGTLPHTMGELLTNLGLVYRRLENYDEAARLNQKALKIKINAVGPKHYSLGISYINLCTLEMSRGNYEKAYEYSLQGLDILKETVTEDHTARIMSTENVLSALVNLERYEEAESYFWTVFEISIKNNTYHRCLLRFHQQMVNYFLNSNQLDKARKVLPYLAPLESTGVAYTQLYRLDMDLPLEERPQRPSHLSLDSGLQRLPDSGYLLMTKIDMELIPRENFEDLKKFFESYTNALKTKHEENIVSGHLINQLAKIASYCEEQKKIPFLVKVLEYGLTVFPDSELLESNLYPKYAHKEICRFDDAFKLLKKLLENSPENRTYHEHLIIMYCQNGKLGEAREHCNVIQQTYPEDEALVSMAASWIERINASEEQLQSHQES